MPGVTRVSGFPAVAVLGVNSRELHRKVDCAKSAEISKNAKGVHLFRLPLRDGTRIHDRSYQYSLIQRHIDMAMTKTIAGKALAGVLLPAVALGLFASPALAYQQSGDTTNVVVTNSNNAAVSNSVVTSANTGGNQANGGKGGKGGNSGDSGSFAGNGGNGGYGGEGGDAGNGAKGGNGGDADVDGDNGGNHGCGNGHDWKKSWNDDDDHDWNNCGDDDDDAGEAYGGFGGDGGNGGMGGEGGDGAMGGEGGNTGDTGNGGNGGAGGDGGSILTGDAYVEVNIANAVNTNDTDVEIEDCGCDKYNEYFESADNYYEKYFNKEGRGDRGHGHKSWGDDDDDDHHGNGGNGGIESYESDESHWEKYSKKYVPVTTNVVVDNENNAAVSNGVSTGADTGNNVADGAKGGKGGTSGASGSFAGNGGEGGNGGAAGDGSNGGKGGHGGDADVDGGNGGVAVGGDAGFGGNGDEGGNGGHGDQGGNGGNTGATGDAGEGGEGGDGGVIVTGYADMRANIANVINSNITRIKK